MGVRTGEGGAVSKPTVGRKGAGAEEGKEKFGATVVKRDRENQCATECHRARGFDLDPTFEHHTGPRHLERRIMRPDTCQHPMTCQNQLRKYLLRMGRLYMLHKSRQGFTL